VGATGGLATRVRARTEPVAVPRRAAVLAAIAGVTAIAALLRFGAFAGVQPNPFYDAAVRSMSQSWHNFFFGAFDPSGAVSVDKPPVDLWFQAASVKLFGFSSVSLRLPEALAGTLAVPLLYDAVRRLFGSAAGIAAALALAVLPVAVETARSDTMDSVLLMLMVLAGWLVILAAQKRRTWLLMAAGVVLGIAFNVKLFEALLPLPAFAALYLIASDAPIRSRIGRLAGAGAVTLAVSISWIVAVSLSPPPKPFPIASTDGTVTNVVVRWNGLDRLGNGAPKTKTPTKKPTTAKAKARAKAKAAAKARAALPTNGPERLFARGKGHYGPLIGNELAAALLLGGLAAALGFGRRLTRRRATPAAGPATRSTPGATTKLSATTTTHGAITRTTTTGSAATVESAAVAPPDRAATPEEAAATARRMRLAGAVAFGMWLVIGAVLFSQVTRLHARYLEAFTAAVAAVLGIGLASLAMSAPRSRVAAAVLALGVSVAAALSIRLSGVGGSTSSIATFAAVAVVAGCVVLMLPRLDAIRGAATGGALTALALVAVLATPTVVARDIVRSGTSDSGRPGYIPPVRLNHLSNYLRAHQGHARYEVVAASAAAVGPLIAKDGRPVLILTTINGRAVLSRAKLVHAVRTGQVHYAMLPAGRCTTNTAGNARCQPAVRWARAHATDVSAHAHLKRGTLFRLSTHPTKHR
jgi:4-amino-4-deoxy-L-arabinose transferase-like glycosyltransferase